jgi:predicted dehydrogenase
MTTRTLNWGILSTARINNALLPPLRASGRNRLLAVASRTKASADAYAREKNIPRAHDSYEALLTDPDIDVIYNPLPNHLHAEWSIKAMQAGKHVLCEKPIALTLAEMDEMTAVSRQTGKILAEAFMYRHHPQTLKVLEIVASGVLGQLRILRGAFSFSLTRDDNYRADASMGGGSLWDVGCYPVSLARTIVGAAPVEVFGQQATGRKGIDESFVGQMRFPNGVYAHFDSSFSIPFQYFMEIAGSEGILYIREPFKPGLSTQLTLTRDGKTEIIDVEGQELYLGEVEDMADAVLEGKTPRVTLEDSRANTATLLALYESARANRPVTL